MKRPTARHKLLTLAAAARVVAAARRRGERVVFTNGCFDLLHVGHVRSLEQARALGDRLVVAVNRDASVRAQKGAGRPIVPARQRAELVAALACVDWVLLFGEPTPLRAIRALRPDLLAKGGEWPLGAIVGRAEVESWGGRVVRLRQIPGVRTTSLVDAIRCAGGGARRAECVFATRSGSHHLSAASELPVDQAEPSIALKRLLDEVGRVVVGQRDLLEGLLTALLAGGHVLVEGVPGLAKTTAVRTLAQALGLGFQRVQFTPDLLPGDLIGTQIYLPDERRFRVRRGPIFSPVLLADEINRAPAKVQSALLEAMEERQVTIGDESLPLPQPFFVMATQNPIEHEGTYPLPEAQVDRFLLKLVVSYPSAEEELEIAAGDGRRPAAVSAVADAATVAALRKAAGAVYVADTVANYAVRVVRATRAPATVGASVPLDGALRAAAGLVAVGASPRASLFLLRAARARALLDGREFATPHDVKRVAPDVLRHRVLLTYEAEADGIAPDAVVAAVLDAVETP